MLMRLDTSRLYLINELAIDSALPDAVDCVAALPHLPHGDARQGLNDVGLGNGVQYILA